MICGTPHLWHLCGFSVSQRFYVVCIMTPAGVRALWGSPAFELGRKFSDRAGCLTGHRLRDNLKRASLLCRGDVGDGVAGGHTMMGRSFEFGAAGDFRRDGTL